MISDCETPGILKIAVGESVRAPEQGGMLEVELPSQFAKGDVRRDDLKIHSTPDPLGAVAAILRPPEITQFPCETVKRRVSNRPWRKN